MEEAVLKLQNLLPESISAFNKMVTLQLFEGNQRIRIIFNEFN